MSLTIYNKARTNRDDINHAISIQYAYYYNDIGKFTITVPIDDYNLQLFENEGILLERKSGTTFIIQNIKHDTTTNRITVNGYTSNSILNKRCVVSNEHISTAEADVYTAVRNNLRGLADVHLAANKGLRNTAEADLHGKQLLESIIPVLDMAELGHRMNWNDDTRNFEFEIYEGVDRTEGIHAVVFSDEYGTATNLIIQDDVSKFKNVFYIEGSQNDEDRTPLVEKVGTATGDNAHEKWLVESPVQSNDESLEDFKARMQSTINEVALDYIRRQSFQVEIAPEELGTEFNIGDVVRCVSVRFGVSFKARITGVKYTLDVTGTTTTLILGEPTLTALGEVKI